MVPVHTAIPFGLVYLLLGLSHARVTLLVFFLMIRRPPRSPLFPSPTLFRSMTNGLSAAPASSRRSRHTARQQPRYTSRIATFAMIASLTYVPVIAMAHTITGTYVKLAIIDRKSTRLNSSHLVISYAVFCLKK